MRVPDDANLDELKKRARRRLVGAVVLALAAAVFVPMLLESDERPLGDDVSVRIPPVDQGKFVNGLNAAAPAADKPAVDAQSTRADAPPAAKADLPLAAKSDAPPSAKSDAPSSSKADAPPTAKADATAAPLPKPDSSAAATDAKSSANEATAPARKDAKAVSAAHSAAATAAPKAAQGAFVVQLAAFSDDKGANALANRLKRSGHPAFTEPVVTSRGTLWRVRVGPYASRDEANAARDKLKREGQSGIVAARTS